MSEEPPKNGLSLKTVAIIAVAVIAGALGIGLLERSGEERPLSSSGFDIASAPPAERPSSGGGRPASAPPPSSLSLVVSGLPQLGPGAGRPDAAAAQLGSLARRSEAACTAVFLRYRARYPRIAQYEKEWMSDPELRRLRHEYMRGDHDPVKFARGVARAKLFPTLVAKYATAPEMQALAQEQMRAADPGMISATAQYLNKDGELKAFVNRVAAALGLPPGLLGGPTGSK